MDLLICETCGQQYGTESVTDLDDHCFICDDPRQFVRAHGQTWTTLAKMRGSGTWRNVITEMKRGAVWSIRTEPKFAIGQRAIFVQEGNVLWDCVTFLDNQTVEWLRGRGGVRTICISHPHYYATSVEWARALDCKVQIFAEDETWRTRPTAGDYELLSKSSASSSSSAEVSSSVTAPGDAQLHHHVRITEDLTFVKIGGHFDGSAVLHSKKGKYILVGDTISLTPGNRRVTIMWSYPNMIPLDVRTIRDVCWPRLSVLDYRSIHAKFEGEDMLERGWEVTRDSLQFYCERLGGSL